jgi:Uma2 family endonuclease
MAAPPYTLPLTLEDYLALPEDNDREREIIRGRLFVAPRSFHAHQIVLLELARLLMRYVLRRGGQRAQLALEVDLLIDALGTYVSPDLMYFPLGAVPVLLELQRRNRRIHVSVVRPDLVVEVLAPGGEARDLEEKRRDYAEAGIPHYWAFDPQERAMHEFVLDPARGAYEHLTHRRASARPRLFADQRPPFTLSLTRLWPERPA